MAGFLYPVLVFVFFAGMLAIDSTKINSSVPTTQASYAVGEGQNFVRYSGAVAAYLRSNPTFTGEVTNANLTSMGYQLPPPFLAIAGNRITQVGSGTGRIITCYADLSAGGLSEVLRITENDASYGRASGTNWISYAYGVDKTPQPLAATVPDGNVVSVIQIGG